MKLKGRIKELRQKTGLTQQKFADKYKIPCRTLQGWELGERECPEYVVELLEYRINNEK